MVETTKPVEITPPSDTWTRLIEASRGGIKIGELTVLIGGRNTGKSRLTEYVVEQMKREQHGI